MALKKDVSWECGSVVEQLSRMVKKKKERKKGGGREGGEEREEEK